MCVYLVWLLYPQISFSFVKSWIKLTLTSVTKTAGCWACLLDYINVEINLILNIYTLHVNIVYYSLKSGNKEMIE